MAQIHLIATVRLQCHLDTLPIAQIAYYIETFVKEVFNFMLGLKSDKMTVLRLNGRLTLTFYEAFENNKKIFDLMLSQESDKMTAV